MGEGLFIPTSPQSAMGRQERRGSRIRRTWGDKSECIPAGEKVIVRANYTHETKKSIGERKGENTKDLSIFSGLI